METTKFRLFLNRFGKSPHVVEELIRQTEEFEARLIAQGKTLSTAQADDLGDYLAQAESERRGGSREKARALALYYQFAARPELAQAASALREREIAKTRRAFPLREFRGLDPAHLDSLEALGIANVEQLLQAGRTPDMRRELAEAAGIPIESVLEMVKLADLARLSGVKAVRARLYYLAGADTVDNLAQWEPEALLRRLAEFVERAEFEGIAPQPKEAQSTIAAARKLPKVVEW
jgi:hypothetical protein